VQTGETVATTKMFAGSVFAVGLQTGYCFLRILKHWERLDGVLSTFSVLRTQCLCRYYCSYIRNSASIRYVLRKEKLFQRLRSNYV